MGPHPLREQRSALMLSLGAMVVCATLLLAAGAEANLLPPGSACNGAQNTHAPEPRQEDGMRCLVNHVRAQAAARGVHSNRALERAAGRKARAIDGCGFSHTPCGVAADKWAHEFGYSSGAGSWQWGENIAWGKSKGGSARQVLKAWLNSATHRETLLRGSFEHLGIGLRRGTFAGHRNAAIWVIQLGCRGC